MARWASGRREFALMLPVYLAYIGLRGRRRLACYLLLGHTLTHSWEPLEEKPEPNQWRYFDPTGDSL